MKNHSAKYRVYYEDTDAGGVVYYGNYLKFAERGRTDFLRESGVNQQVLAKETGVFFVVRKVEIEYLSPGRLDDIIEVKTAIARIGKTSIDMTQEFFNQDGTKLGNMTVQIVTVMNDGNKIRSTRIPEEIVKHFS